MLLKKFRQYVDSIKPKVRRPRIIRISADPPTPFVINYFGNRIRHPAFALAGLRLPRPKDSIQVFKQKMRIPPPKSLIPRMNQKMFLGSPGRRRLK